MRQAVEQGVFLLGFIPGIDHQVGRSVVFYSEEMRIDNLRLTAAFKTCCRVPFLALLLSRETRKLLLI